MADLASDLASVYASINAPQARLQEQFAQREQDQQAYEQNKADQAAAEEQAIQQKAAENKAAEEKTAHADDWDKIAKGTYFDIPSFAEGTPSVPATTLAVVHKGEKITPASENSDNPANDIYIGGKNQFPTPASGPVKVLGSEEPVKLSQQNKFVTPDISNATKPNFSTAPTASSPTDVKRGVAVDDPTNRVVPPPDYLISIPGVPHLLHLPANAPKDEVDDISRELHQLWNQRGK
jgi:hypothetical protein